MQVYKDRSGKSGVSRFCLSDTSIDIEFVGGKTYRYDYQRPGQLHVERMKELAISGEDLATYCNKHVRKNFAVQLV